MVVDENCQEGHVRSMPWHNCWSHFASGSATRSGWKGRSSVGGQLFWRYYHLEAACVAKLPHDEFADAPSRGEGILKLDIGPLPESHRESPEQYRSTCEQASIIFPGWRRRVRWHPLGLGLERAWDVTAVGHVQLRRPCRNQ